MAIEVSRIKILANGQMRVSFKIPIGKWRITLSQFLYNPDTGQLTPPRFLTKGGFPVSPVYLPSPILERFKQALVEVLETDNEEEWNECSDFPHGSHPPD